MPQPDHRLRPSSSTDTSVYVGYPQGTEPTFVIPSHPLLDRRYSGQLEVLDGVSSRGHDLRHTHESDGGRTAQAGNRARSHSTESPQCVSVSGDASTSS